MWLDYKDELQQSCCCVSPCKSYVRDSSPQQLKIRFLTEREDYFSSNWYLSSCIESEWEPNPPCCNVDMAKEDEVGVKPWNLHNWNADFGELFTPWLCPIFVLLTIFRGRRNQEAKMALKPKPAEEEPEKRRSKVKARCLGIWLIHVGGMLIDYKNTVSRRKQNWFKTVSFPRLHFFGDWVGSKLFCSGIGFIHIYKVFSLFCAVLLQLISSVPNGMYSLVSL